MRLQKWKACKAKLAREADRAMHRPKAEKVFEHRPFEQEYGSAQFRKHQYG
jgi:hypothetical protein